MRIAALLLFLAGVGLFVWTAGNQLPGEPPPGAERHPGFAPYRDHCAKCHGLGGRSERAAEMADEAVSLVDPRWRSRITRGEIRRIIVEGKGEMERIDARVADAEIERIVDFVLWIPVEPPPGDAPDSTSETP